MTPTLRRAALAALAGLGAALALAGCSQSPASAIRADDCTPQGLPGTASEAVAAEGAFGQSLAMSTAGPLAADHLEVSRHGAGSGPVLTPAGVLEGRFSIIALDDGTPLVSDLPLAAADDGSPLPVTVNLVGAQLPGAAAALQCAQAGERVIAAMPAAQLFGAESQAFVADPNRTVALGIDVTRVYPSSAGGRILPPVDGIPAVVTAPDGRPGATMPQSAPPTELRTALRVEGFGEPIAAGDALTLHVSIFDWTSGAELASTWDDANSVMRTAAGEQDGLYGVTAELVGRPAGSQLIAVVPTELALSRQGPVAASLATGRTLVLVIDVLAADAPA